MTPTSLHSTNHFILLLFVCWALSPAIASATLCSPTHDLVAPGTAIAYPNDLEPIVFSAQVPEDRFFLAEAQTTNAAGRRPRIRFLDDRCSELQYATGVAELRGRKVAYFGASTTILVEIQTHQGAGPMWIDTWTDHDSPLDASVLSMNNDTTDPVPETPIDEWEEVRHPARRGQDQAQAASTDEDSTSDDETEPVPPTPIDEWEEVFFDPIDSRQPQQPMGRELHGAGILTDPLGHLEWRPWCAWTSPQTALATITCARRVELTIGAPVTLSRIIDDRPEIVGLMVHDSGRVDVNRADTFVLLDARGEQHDHSEVRPGLYFLRVEASGPTYEVMLSH